MLLLSIIYCERLFATGLTVTFETALGWFVTHEAEDNRVGMLVVVVIVAVVVVTGCEQQSGEYIPDNPGVYEYWYLE